MPTVTGRGRGEGSREQGEQALSPNASAERNTGTSPALPGRLSGAEYKIRLGFPPCSLPPAPFPLADSQAGIQELAGNATLLYYMTEEGSEGKQAFLEKRQPDFRNYPWLP